MKTLSKVIEKDDKEAMARWTSQGPISVKNGKIIPAGNKANGVEEAKKKFQQGYEEGFEKGLQEGRAKGQQETKINAKKLTDIAAAMAQPYSEIDEAAEAEFINLALALAKQIVKRELQTQPEAIASVVHEVLSGLVNVTSNVIVAINPEDAKVLKGQEQSFAEVPNVVFREDPSISRGGCRVQSNSSRIDATIEKQFEQLAQQLSSEEEEG